MRHTRYEPDGRSQEIRFFEHILKTGGAVKVIGKGCYGSHHLWNSREASGVVVGCYCDPNSLDGLLTQIDTTPTLGVFSMSIIRDLGVVFDDDINCTKCNELFPESEIDLSSRVEVKLSNQIAFYKMNFNIPEQRRENGRFDKAAYIKCYTRMMEVIKLYVKMDFPQPIVMETSNGYSTLFPMDNEAEDDEVEWCDDEIEWCCEEMEKFTRINSSLFDNDAIQIEVLHYDDLFQIDLPSKMFTGRLYNGGISESRVILKDVPLHLNGGLWWRDLEEAGIILSRLFE